jgi:hypothetical protein
MKWSRGPLVSCNHHLNGSCRSPARACDTHVGQPSLSRAWAHRDSSPTSLSPPHLRSLLLLPALPLLVCSPSPTVTKVAHHRPCETIAQPSSAEGAATPLSSNQRLTTPGDHFSPPPASSRRSHHRLTAPDLLRPSQHLEELCKTPSPPPPLFLFDHTATTSDPPSMPPTSFPFCRVAPPPADHSGEHPTALHPKCGSPSIGLPPQPLHRRPPTAGRLDFDGQPLASMGEKISLIFVVGQKGQVR